MKEKSNQKTFVISEARQNIHEQHFRSVIYDSHLIKSEAI